MARTREELAKYHRDRRRKKKLAGICMYCPNPHAPGSSAFCRFHLDSMRSKLRAKLGVPDLDCPEDATCVICGTANRLVPDHDHSSGKFRGWLCSNHNIGIGFFHDNPDLLIKAANYLQSHASMR